MSTLNLLNLIENSNDITNGDILCLITKSTNKAEFFNSLNGDNLLRIEFWADYNGIPVAYLEDELYRQFNNKATFKVVESDDCFAKCYLEINGIFLTFNWNLYNIND